MNSSVEKGSAAQTTATTRKCLKPVLCAGLLVVLLPYPYLNAQEVEQPPEAEEPVVAESQEVPEPEDEEKKPVERSSELAEKLDRRQKEAEAQSRSERRGELYYESEAVVEAAPQSQGDVQQDDVDILDIDVSDSIDSAVEKEGYFQYGGDLRVAYNWADRKFRNGDDERDDDITGRLRFESQFNPTDNFRVTGRVAWRCSTKGCDPNLDWAGDEDGGSVEPGTMTIDELFVHWFRTDRFNVAAGRMQTRAITRGGVFANSLDRSNSSGTSVTYTDGLYATYRPSRLEGWTIRLISEYNDEDGATTIRRDPLDFSTSDSKVSHYLGFGNNNPSDLFVQRDFGITYLPDALLVEGDEDGKRDDYWGFVGRTAMRIPLGEGLRRLQLAGEVGYAPDTPEEQALDIGGAGLTGTDDADGLAWNVSASVMDLYPNHSVGILYARTGAGWLLSPNYLNNLNRAEIRYSWRPDTDLVIDARLRYRKEIDRLNGADRRSEEWQFFVRATVRYSIDNLNIFNLFD